MGIFSSNQDLQKEQFPNYELIDLSFDLTNLEELTSAQLAVRFSPFLPQSRDEYLLRLALTGRRLSS